MKTYVITLLSLALGMAVGAPAPEAAPEAANEVDSRSILLVQVCGGTNWQTCAELGVDNCGGCLTPMPWDTFGSYNTRGHTCHCYSNADNQYSGEFSGENGNVIASWGNYWFYNCDRIGCW